MKFKLMLAVCFCVFNFNLSAQQSEATVMNRGNLEITLDGNASEWEEIEAIPIERNFQAEIPTVDASWKALWDDEGIYVLVIGEDDVWAPNWLTGDADWMSDKIELYIDLSDPQQDGGGASMGMGNWQIAPNFSETDQGIMHEFTGYPFLEGSGIYSADTYDEEGAYIIEYFVPWDAIPDSDDLTIDPWVTAVVGFDVTIVDNDNDGNGRQRKVWSNEGMIDESWNNMDDVGLITLSGNLLNAIYANFSVSDQEVYTGTEIQFTDNSSGDITSWAWEFGDGYTSTEQNPSHTYTEAGTYTVRLTVANATDADTETKVNFIQVNTPPQPPVVDFSADNTYPDVNVLVSFTDLSTNNPYAWAWDFGDGSIANFQNPSHKYEQAGVYSVTLTATNEIGETTLTKSDLIIVAGGTSVNEKLADKAFNVSPNPSNGIFVVSLIEEAKKIEIIDSKGSKVIEIDNPGFTQTFDISKNAKGIYFLMVEFEAKIQTKKIVVD